MTTVYGVTKYGAKHQIARQLRGIHLIIFLSFYLLSSLLPLFPPSPFNTGTIDIFIKHFYINKYCNINILCRYTKFSTRIYLAC